MDNTEVNILQEIPAYERRYRKISEWFLNCKPAYAILKFIYKYMAYIIAFAYILLIIICFIFIILNICTQKMYPQKIEGTFLVTSEPAVLFETMNSFGINHQLNYCLFSKFKFQQLNFWINS